ncbi:MAG TPA: acyl-ACP--UDP-N-acetylglucosamine O-acyltransferase [Candidatus Acidoferrales bacterium]|nr:acyl-ACP--UDP-N-acetylglucosamine O-acyltransferase [Candidatus Acidoferrales bacterium]
MIHPTAIIHPKARLGSGIQVGPYSVIDADVEIGAGCVLGPYVYLTGVTKIGSGNKFHAAAVIGDAPQDLKYKDGPTGLRIGDNNVFREHTTVHRSNKPDEETVIGSNNFIMGNAHIAHNCRVGNHVIIANGTLLAGHVEVQDRAFLSGNCVIHQFCRIGTLAMMQGGAAASQDVPPFTMAKNGMNILCGLNTVGLRRANFSSEERLELRKLYKFVFRSGKNLRPALAEAKGKFTGPAVKVFLDFIAAAKRGVCSDPGKNGLPEEE